MDFYHYRMDVYTHFQHTFMFKQLVKLILHPMTPLRPNKENWRNTSKGTQYVNMVSKCECQESRKSCISHSLKIQLPTDFHYFLICATKILSYNIEITLTVLSDHTAKKWSFFINYFCLVFQCKCLNIQNTFTWDTKWQNIWSQSKWSEGSKI